MEASASGSTSREHGWAWGLAQSIGLIALSAFLAWITLHPRSAHAPASTIEPPKAPVSIAGAAQDGSPTAPVALIEFSDFECPFCRQFANRVYPQIQQNYVQNGKAAVIFRHLPLDIHADARRAAAAGECARRADRFWALHDEMFRAPSLDAQAINALWAKAGLKQEALDRCAADAMSTVDADVAMAGQFGIQGTPAFMIGVRVAPNQVKVLQTISGAQSFRVFADALDAAATKAR